MTIDGVSKAKEGCLVMQFQDKPDLVDEKYVLFLLPASCLCSKGILLEALLLFTSYSQSPAPVITTALGCIESTVVEMDGPVRAVGM
jgi:hypothetical protein